MPTDRITRVLLFIYGAAIGVPAVWALAAPQSFYDDFPGFGRHWVALEGEPYNEHLVRDFGSLSLALTVVIVAAAVLLTVRIVQLAMVASLVDAIPHFIYHMSHLDKLDTPDQIGNVITLGLQVLVPIIVLVMVSRRLALAH